MADWRLVSHPLRWSLRGQIRALGAMVLATVVLVVVLAVLLVQRSQSARLADAAHHLDRALNQLAERYANLRSSFVERHLADPLESGDESLLQSLTNATLIAVPGVEGGFYRMADRRLLGYAYPTYYGSGPKTDIPSAERPTIERVAGTAVDRQAPAEESVAAGPDLILFRALPLITTGRPVGALWVMERLGALRSPYDQLYRLGLFGLLAVSGTTATAAWFFTRRLDRGVARTVDGLRAMEDRLDTPVPTTGIAELDRVGSAINRLAGAVQTHQKERAQLEHRLHRADRLAALGRLVGGVAHEVRNPLASIKLKLHLALRSVTDRDRLAGAFAVIQAEVERLDRLVARLLTLAKPSEPSRVPTDVARLLQTRMEHWEGTAAAQGIVLEFQPSPSIAEPVPVDGDRIVQIVDNLLANAVEALHETGGRILVEMDRPTPSAIRIAVADTGPGVPPETVERLFEPFFTTRKHGTGLGLFLSAEITRALGGELRYRERAGGGACFEVLIPC